ncbi:hypothetical protein [Nonomuraea zeae]|uniref:Secreted protein n=1 Tax=Nonomuraea zeae TaxID=1642303 RepID=A0A5S4FBT9_9ACTN|nr:hypothetical protein [Nonomuraea zeae]TMR14376.1 hypothetical protein ETD85_56775 [Nonomuraea zeae]
MKLIGRTAGVLAGGALLIAALTTPAAADTLAAGGPVGALLQPVFDVLNMLNNATSLTTLLPSGALGG